MYLYFFEILGLLSNVPYFLSFLEITLKKWEKIYFKGDTVTTSQLNFHWRLSICRTVIRVYLYCMHKILGPISERSCNTNFPLLRWTETASHPVCFSSLIKDENLMGWGLGIPAMSKNINLITQSCSQLDTHCNGSSVVLVLLTTSSIYTLWRGNTSCCPIW